jgi:hypothetical protein
MLIDEISKEKKMSRYISVDVERHLYAESMGRCMNPDCKEDLFKKNGDIVEKAHIDSYCDSKENTFENLVVLCPNCHTDFDKNAAFSKEEVRKWKKIREEEFQNFFCIKYTTFHDLEKKVKPILLENQMIYDNYFKNGDRVLWDQFEGKLLSNNGELRSILNHNLNLIQRQSDDNYSNLFLIKKFLLHIDEFEATRCESEKIRRVLYPVEINSLFGLEPIDDSFIPSVESIEALIEALKEKDQFELIMMGVDNPYVQLKEGSESVRVYLKDSPRLRQLYFDNNCFRKTNVRVDSLNYALKIIKSSGLKFRFIEVNNLREVEVNGIKIVFIYEYCLSKIYLQQLFPDANTVIVNLHNWNGMSCISNEAYELAQKMNVTLLRTDELYEYIRNI